VYSSGWGGGAGSGGGSSSGRGGADSGGDDSDEECGGGAAHTRGGRVSERVIMEQLLARAEGDAACAVRGADLLELEEDFRAVRA
jgi:hypothetical protein